MKSPKISFKTEGGGNSPSIFAAQSLVSDIEKSGIFTKDYELSNGDAIKFTWTFNPQTIESKYSVNLQYSDIDYKIDTLQDLEMVDAFNFVSLEYSGVSSDGTASFDLDENLAMTTRELITDYFDIAPNTSLSNGDTVTVTISNAGLKEMASEYGQKPIETSKDYTVEGLFTFTGVDPDFFDEVKSLSVDEFYGNKDYFEPASEETHNEVGIPRNFLGVLDENGNQLLNEGYIARGEFYDWMLDNRWLADTELQSFEYVGYYAAVIEYSLLSDYELYLVYDVTFSQYGTTDEENPAPVTGGRSDFEYYWCANTIASIEYDENSLTCTLVPEVSTPTVYSFGEDINHITYYIDDARTNEVGENKIKYTGFSHDGNLTDALLAQFPGIDVHILATDISD